VGETHFEDGLPAVAAKLERLNHELAGRDFDRQDVTNTIQQTVEEIFQDAGYLDVRNDAPVFSTPRKELTQYVVDTQVTLHPGALYHISMVAFRPEPPLSDAELRAVLPFKAGDAASASDFRVALGELALAYAGHGYLEAKSAATVSRDRANHTMSYSFTFTPGAQFHVASIDTSGLSSDLQQEFRGVWNVAPGAVCDRELTLKLRAAVQQLHSPSTIYAVEQRDSAAHMVVIKLQLRKPTSGGAGPGGGLELQ
jgi:outer membrane protein assembly factor BamA